MIAEGFCRVYLQTQRIVLMRKAIESEQPGSKGEKMSLIIYLTENNSHNLVVYFIGAKLIQKNSFSSTFNVVIGIDLYKSVFKNL